MTPKRNTDQILISCARVLSHFSHVQLFVTPWSTAHQALFMGFSRQEHWSGLPCPLPGDLLNPEIEPTSLTSPPGPSDRGRWPAVCSPLLSRWVQDTASQKLRGLSPASS